MSRVGSLGSSDQVFSLINRLADDANAGQQKQIDQTLKISKLAAINAVEAQKVQQSAQASDSAGLDTVA